MSGKTNKIDKKKVVIEAKEFLTEPKLSRAERSKRNKQKHREAQAAEVAIVKQETKVIEGEVMGPGRPTRYSKKLAAKICQQISMGNSLRSVCREPGMPAPSSVFLWLGKYKEFSEQYAHACEERSEAFAEDILDISDDGTNDWMEINRGGETFDVVNREAIERSKLRVTTRQWLMERMKPKKYGTQIDITSDGEQIQTPIIALPVKVPNRPQISE